MRVNLPFKRMFKDTMLNNLKTCTSRTKKYGSPGDTFDIFGATFKITAVESKKLEDVANHLYRFEGFAHPSGFIFIWQRIHPNAGYRPEQEVYVHWFQKIREN